MTHFVAKLQFSIHVAGLQTQQFEEQLILVEAYNKQEAHNTATYKGKEQEDEFLNTNSNKVCWRFEGVTHLERIGDIGNGTVLFSELKDDYSTEQLTTLQQRIRKMKETSLSIPLCNN